MQSCRDSLNELVHWLYETRLLEVEGLEQRARLLLLDTLGCFIAAQTHSEPQQLAKQYASLDPGNISLPGVNETFSVSSACMLLALGGGWDEACEGLARAHGRPGLHAIPPVLAIGLARQLDLSQILIAIISGYEIGARLGEQLRIRDGMHVDGAWGSLGAAAAAARALNTNQAACLSAIETAACQIPFSLYTAIATGARARNTYCGHAAQLGLMSAVTAKSGITAPMNAIEDYFQIALGKDKEDLNIAGPDEFMILQGYLKIFAAVRHVHYGAQCAINYRENNRGTIDIKGLTLRTYQEAIRYCYHKDPKNVVQAQFSLSYAVAHALVAGSLNPKAYSSASLYKPETRRLEQLLKIELNEALGKPEQRGAELIIDTADDGQSITVDKIMGDPGFPIDEKLVRDKFESYAGGVVGALAAKKMADKLLSAPLNSPITDLFTI